ncbi:MAG: leucine-rich repeat domain-containing protein [Lachnospiraceae bacterium]|nr:leucine-rich repeat domain-containing protein [Robinsoniella sp.]MDY3765320.1 leucine-rich repeat domain-containing protein [Lachnospiraceae bacterium]
MSKIKKVGCFLALMSSIWGLTADAADFKSYFQEDGKLCVEDKYVWLDDQGNLRFATNASSEGEILQAKDQEDPDHSFVLGCSDGEYLYYGINEENVLHIYQYVFSSKESSWIGEVENGHAVVGYYNDQVIVTVLDEDTAQINTAALDIWMGETQILVEGYELTGQYQDNLVGCPNQEEIGALPLEVYDMAGSEEMLLSDGVYGWRLKDQYVYYAQEMDASKLTFQIVRHDLVTGEEMIFSEPIQTTKPSVRVTERSVFYEQDGKECEYRFSSFSGEVTETVNFETYNIWTKKKIHAGEWYAWEQDNKIWYASDPFRAGEVLVGGTEDEETYHLSGLNDEFLVYTVNVKDDMYIYRYCFTTGEIELLPVIRNGGSICGAYKDLLIVSVNPPYIGDGTNNTVMLNMKTKEVKELINGTALTDQYQQYIIGQPRAYEAAAVLPLTVYNMETLELYEISPTAYDDYYREGQYLYYAEQIPANDEGTSEERPMYEIVKYDLTADEKEVLAGPFQNKGGVYEVRKEVFKAEEEGELYAYNYYTGEKQLWEEYEATAKVLPLKSENAIIEQPESLLWCDSSEDKFHVGNVYVWKDGNNIWYAAEESLEGTILVGDNGEEGRIYDYYDILCFDGNSLFYSERGSNGFYQNVEIYRYQFIEAALDQVAEVPYGVSVDGYYKGMFIARVSDPTDATALYTITLDMQTGEIKKVTDDIAFTEQYKNYLVGRPNTGAVSALPLEVYDLETGETQILSEKAYSFYLKDQYLYYSDEMNMAYENYEISFEFQVICYDLLTGEKKVISDKLKTNQPYAEVTDQSVIYTWRQDEDPYAKREYFYSSFEEQQEHSADLIILEVEEEQPSGESEPESFSEKEIPKETDIEDSKEIDMEEEKFEYRTIEDGTVEIVRYRGKETILAIPSVLEGKTVSKIGGCAFSGCNTLMSITIPESVTQIGRDAFSYCYFLEEITIPKSVSHIGERVFDSCYSLKNIDVDENNQTYLSEEGILFDKQKTKLICYPAGKGVEEVRFSEDQKQIQWRYTSREEAYMVPQSVTEIADSAFAHCGFLKTIKISSSVVSIGDRAFYACTGLSNMVLPESLEYIGAEAFSNCNDLTEIYIPQNVKEIGGGAFYACSSLEIIDVDLKNSIYLSHKGVLFNKKETKMLQYPSGKQDADYIIPEGVTSIGKRAISQNDFLETLTISQSVTKIEEEGIYYCQNLRYFNVNAENAAYIGQEGVLFDKTKTKLIQYPSGKKDEVYTIPEGVNVIRKRAFSCNRFLKTLMVPKTVTEIEEESIYECPDLGYISVDAENVGYIAEDGVLFTKDKAKLIRYPGRKVQNTYRVPQSVVSIETAAFEGAKNLSEIEISENVVNIGKKAFLNCSSLATVVIPENVTSIGAAAFPEVRNITILNRKCTIDDNKVDGEIKTIGTFGLDVHIYGYVDSSAESFAEKWKEEGKNFIALEEKPETILETAAEGNELSIERTPHEIQNRNVSEEEREKIYELYKQKIIHCTDTLPQRFICQYYALYDFTGDGMEELIVNTGTCYADYTNHVYTYNYNNGEIHYLGRVGGGHQFMASDPEGNFVLHTRYQGMAHAEKVVFDGLSFQMESLYEPCKAEEAPDLELTNLAIAHQNDFSLLNRTFLEI